MILEKLVLNNFRNYKSCSLTFNNKLNFIHGDNGNGKTNLLEAISLVCFSKSFLQVSDKDCLKYGENNFNIHASLKNKNEVDSFLKYYYSLETNDKKIITNSGNVKKISEHIGKNPLILFSPQDMRLSYGLPSDRRRNFDILLSQMSSLYLNELKCYNKILKQKNALLKENILKKLHNEDLRILLDGWNEDLIRSGAIIISKRIEFVNTFSPYLNRVFYEISSERCTPVFSYHCDYIQLGMNTDEIMKCLRSSVKAVSQQEIRRGHSLVGPHRDDWNFRIVKNNNEFDLKNFASQGEQKSYIIALKCAEYFFLRNVLGERSIGEPIVILDDVFSELDSARVKQIAQIITGFNQVFLTTTNISYLDVLKDYYNETDVKSIKIINGRAV